MAKWHAHMRSTLWRESAPEFDVFKAWLANPGTGTQPQPRLHHTAALDGRDHTPSPERQSIVLSVLSICPGLGLGQGTFPSQGAQPHSQLSQHHHQAPLSLGSIPWWLLELLPRLICAFLLPISFSSFPSTTPGPGLLRRIFLLCWQMHRAELRGWSTPLPENALAAGSLQRGTVRGLQPNPPWVSPDGKWSLQEGLLSLNHAVLFMT